MSDWRTRYGTLGYRGHVLTKTRRYSTTFGALRRARQTWRRTPIAARNNGEAIRQAGEDEDPDGDQADIVIERSWRFAGAGYFDTDTAARALASAVLAREGRWPARSHTASFTSWAPIPRRVGPVGQGPSEAQPCP